RLPADRVEETPEQQRAEEVADGEDDQEDGDVARGDAPEGRVERPEVEGDAVVEERLADEERETEDRAARGALEGGLGDPAERECLPRRHGDRLRRLLEVLVGLALPGLLDVADDRLRLVLAAVDEEPARALRDVPPDDEDAEPDHGAEQEGEAPADVRREEGL